MTPPTPHHPASRFPPADDVSSPRCRARIFVELGGKIDGVETIFKEPRWPVLGTKAEKRTERAGRVLASARRAFGPGPAAGLPVPGRGSTSPSVRKGEFLYSPATPLYGLTFGLSILAIGIGAVLFQKKFIPEEISVQDRHDGRLPELHRKTIAANLTDALEGPTVKRRKLIGLALGIGPGAFRRRHPGRLHRRADQEPVEAGSSHRRGQEGRVVDLGLDALWFHGETIYLARATGRPGVSVRQDAARGSRRRWHGNRLPGASPTASGTTVESEHHLTEISMGVRNPVMLIRIKPADMSRVVKRKGQESFNFGELFAYTKVCSHLGCPSSLYEQQTYRILCPCHQSQFDALHFAKPIFGPAARALAQLPITIDKDGYLVANGDFVEPVGPAFWERKS